MLPAFRANERERSDDQDTFLTLGAAILYFKEKSLLLGFKLIVGRVKGRKVYMICNQNRTLKCACSFTISHESDDIWRVTFKKEEHNHQLLSPAQVALKYREVPEELKSRAVHLAMLGVDFRSTINIIKEEFKGEMFLNKDVTAAIQKHFSVISSKALFGDQSSPTGARST